MSDFLFACIEEAKKAGLYAESRPQGANPNLPSLFSIIDNEIDDCSFKPATDDNEQLPTHEVVDMIPVEISCSATLSDIPPLPSVNERLGRDNPGEVDTSAEYLAELKKILRQETLYKETISKLSSELHRLRRNHGFELRLLQKTVSQVSMRDSKDIKKTAELAERLIKVSTERDFLHKEIFRLEERVLFMKQYLMDYPNDSSNSLIVLGSRGEYKLTCSTLPITIVEMTTEENVEEFDLLQDA
jgi:hypothetical protein